MTPNAPSNSQSPYSCIFFDFDGVIADSVDAKIDAFGELYDQFGSDVRRTVEDYQRKVPGETRFEKIPRFHKHLLGIDLNDDEVLEWCNRLSEIVLERIVSAPLLPDVREVLSMLARQPIQAHIISGTPQVELQIIAERKGLAPFFRSMRGSPESKISIVKDIMQAEGLREDQCLFVGDAMSDFNCAADREIAFLGCSKTAQHPFPTGTKVVQRLGEYFFEEEQAARATSRMEIIRQRAAMGW